MVRIGAGSFGDGGGGDQGGRGGGEHALRAGRRGRRPRRERQRRGAYRGHHGRRRAHQRSGSGAGGVRGGPASGARPGGARRLFHARRIYGRAPPWARGRPLQQANRARSGRHGRGDRASAARGGRGSPEHSRVHQPLRNGMPNHGGGRDGALGAIEPRVVFSPGGRGGGGGSDGPGASVARGGRRYVQRRRQRRAPLHGEDGPLGDGRCWPSLPVHHQPVSGDGRRRGAWAPRGRNGGQHGVLPVPPHGALFGGCCG
mmetsp:Transcript_18866/g.61570  ORF Transcript_18866/g.61570 Transcript_18866/m.61570 type:complete len:258 (+) Transcript_18866:235-1008(+)